MSINDFVIENGVLVKYTGTDENVIIPNGVKKIADCAFIYNKTVKTVVIPDGVEVIGQSAFKYNDKLISIEIPDTVKKIGCDAFFECQKLKTFVVPEGVEKIEESTFYNCKALKEVVLPESVKKIGAVAFYGCSTLKNITFPQKLTGFGVRAFTGCKNLADEDGFFIVNGSLLGYFGASENVVIPNSVKKIDGCFFEKSKIRAKDVKTVTIPDSVKSIGPCAFHGFENLADENGFVIIRDVLYSYHGNSSDVVVPDGVIKIGECAFVRSKILTVSLPEGVKEIGSEAFARCNKLLQINIPESVTSINSKAFGYCENLNRINLHVNVTKIGSGAFVGCKRLTVCAPEGSVAIEYAQKNKMLFECISSERSVDINSLSKDEKIKTAIKAYEANVSQMEALMKKSGYENAPYPSDNSVFYPCIGEKSDIDAAYEFLGEVERMLTKKSLGFDKKDGSSASAIVDEIKTEFNAIVDSKASEGGYCGIYHIRTFVAVGLASYYFLSTDTTMNLEFNRDKWEAAGEYCSKQKAVYRISANDNGGKVFANNYKGHK